jgi:hypothetical protein
MDSIPAKKGERCVQGSKGCMRGTGKHEIKGGRVQGSKGRRVEGSKAARQQGANQHGNNMSLRYSSMPEKLKPNFRKSALKLKFGQNSISRFSSEAFF